MTQKLQAAYAQIRVGNPLDEATLMGPLIDRGSVDAMQNALDTDPGGRRRNSLRRRGDCAGATCSRRW